MIQALVAALKDTCASVENMPKLTRPVPKKNLSDIELPVPISEVRLGSSPMHSIAKGAWSPL